MCPEFERVERIVQNMVDGAEKVRRPVVMLVVRSISDCCARRRLHRTLKFQTKSTWSRGFEDRQLAMTSSFRPTSVHRESFK